MPAQQLKVNINDEALIDFLDRCDVYGFKDKSELTRAALECLRQKKMAERLKKSAALYAEIYKHDDELQDLSDVQDLKDD